MSSSGRIDELRKKFDENPRRYFAPLANEYRKVGDLDQAIFICQEYLPQQPGHMSGHIVYGQALFEAKRPDDARAVFETALTLDPENLIALRHLGDIAREAGDFAAARGWYQRVLEADPRNEEIAGILNGLLTAPAPSVPYAPPAPLAPPAAAESADHADVALGEPHQDESPTPEWNAAPDEGFEIGTPDVELTSAVEPEHDFTPTSLAATDPPPPAESDAFAAADDEPFEEFSFASGFGGPPTAPPGDKAAPASVAVEPADSSFIPEDGPFVTELPGSALDPDPAVDEDLSVEEGFQLEGLEPTHHDRPADDVRDAEAPAQPLPGATADDLLDLEEAFQIPGADAPKAAAGAESWVEATATEKAPADASVTGYDPQDTAAEIIEDPAPGDTPVAASDDLAVAPDAMFATETMADLYLAQGHRQEAARIFEQLLAERPDDAHLQARLDELRRPAAPPGPTVREFLQQLFTGGMAAGNGSGLDVAAPVEAFDAVDESMMERTSAPVAPAPSIGGALDQLFGGAEPTAAAQAAALVLADAFAGDRAGDSASPPDSAAQPLRGRPALRASAELSLDTVFRDEPPRQAQGFSFDQFFAEGGTAPASGETGDPAPPPADDVAQFNDWLDGLKKS